MSKILLEKSATLTAPSLNTGDAFDVAPQWLPRGEFAGMRIVRRIGAGGMGVVYLAHDERLDRQVALKVIGCAGRPSDPLREQFLLEARAAARIDHPNVIRVFTVGELDDRLYIVTEFVDGPSLDQVATPMRATRLALVAVDLARALAAAHGCGILHCDVKPANVLAGSDGRVKLGDFGLARLLQAGSEPGALAKERALADQLLGRTPVEVSETGSVSASEPGGRLLVLGTPHYLAPELWAGKAATPASDLYALGALLFALAVGRSPARILSGGEAISDYALARLVRGSPAPSVASFAGKIPGALAHFIDQCLERDPAARPESAAWLADELAQIAADLSAAGPAGSEGEQGLAPRSGRGRDASAARPGRDKPRDKLIGRRRELAVIERMLVGGQRVVTVRGAAGTGKTRLAVQVLDRWGDDPAPLFCDVTDCDNALAVCAAVANALDIPLTATDLAECAEQIGYALANRGNTLVVVDNFEQVVSAAADTLGVWVRLAPRAQFLVTSQRPLRLESEQLFELDPLPVPPEDEADAEAIATYEAVQLFAHRARKAAPDAETDGEDAVVIAAIVRELDGIPLAIELAAARMAVLTPQEILERMSGRFQLLRKSGRKGPDRHATLQNAIAWSWELLNPHESEALSQCATFRGGFTLDAAEAVLCLAEDAPPVLDLIQELRETSLLRRETAGGPGSGRFTLFESVREFAAGKLASSAARARVAQAHAAHYLAVGEPAAAAVRGPDGVAALDYLQAELGNLVQAVNASDSRAARARLVLIADRLLEVRGPTHLRLELLARIDSGTADGGSESGDGKAELWSARGRARQALGELAEAEAALDTALQNARASGPATMATEYAVDLAIVLRDRGDSPRAKQLLESALESARTLGDEWLLAYTLLNLGAVEHWRGEYGQAKRWYLEGFPVARRTGDRRLLTFYLCNLGLAHMELLEVSEAARCFESASEVCELLRDRRSQAVVSINLTSLRLDEGRIEEAKQAVTVSLELARAVGDRRTEGVALGELGRTELERGAAHRARECFEAASDILSGAGEQRYVAVYAAFDALAAAQIEGDAVEDVSVIASRLESSGETTLGPLMDMVRALVALRAGDESSETRSTRIEAAERLVAEGIADSQRSLVRSAARSLRAALLTGQCVSG